MCLNGADADERPSRALPLLAFGLRKAWNAHQLEVTDKFCTQQTMRFVLLGSLLEGKF